MGREGDGGLALEVDFEGPRTQDEIRDLPNLEALREPRAVRRRPVDHRQRRAAARRVVVKARRQSLERLAPLAVEQLRRDDRDVPLGRRELVRPAVRRRRKVLRRLVHALAPGKPLLGGALVFLGLESREEVDDFADADLDAVRLRRGVAVVHSSDRPRPSREPTRGTQGHHRRLDDRGERVVSVVVGSLRPRCLEQQPREGVVVFVFSSQRGGRRCRRGTGRR
mmetsp:Transcript_10523/g.34772  ORF Transcript_10523/g.34772 Transcript_10523/m.34772 type:complete len:224 (-) Transcript_10523:582-1253(-)